jgi:hypothetical protein
MSELQRRIKRNWSPPRGNESKRVILLFKIACEFPNHQEILKQTGQLLEQCS